MALKLKKILKYSTDKNQIEKLKTSLCSSRFSHILHLTYLLIKTIRFFQHNKKTKVIGTVTRSSTSA